MCVRSIVIGPYIIGAPCYVYSDVLQYILLNHLHIQF